MKEIFSTITYEIEPVKSAALRVGKSRQLRVETGVVWLTRSGDATDYWLTPGTTLDLRAGETLWLSAERGQPARLVFQRPALGAMQLAGWLSTRLSPGHGHRHGHRSAVAV